MRARYTNRPQKTPFTRLMQWQGVKNNSHTTSNSYIRHWVWGCINRIHIHLCQSLCLYVCLCVRWSGGRLADEWTVGSLMLMIDGKAAFLLTHLQNIQFPLTDANKQKTVHTVAHPSSSLPGPVLMEQVAFHTIINVNSGPSCKNTLMAIILEHNRKGITLTPQSCGQTFCFLLPYCK